MSSKNQNGVLAVVHTLAFHYRRLSSSSDLEAIGITPCHYSDLALLLEERFAVNIPVLVLDTWINCKDVIITIDLLVAGENPCWSL